jgi:hypothetical protein
MVTEKILCLLSLFQNPPDLVIGTDTIVTPDNVILKDNVTFGYYGL